MPDWRSSCSNGSVGGPPTLDAGTHAVQVQRTAPPRPVCAKAPNGKKPTDAQFAAAIAAAPYIHPRLASTDRTVKSDNVHRVVSDRPMTLEEWQQKFALQIEGDAADDDIVKPAGNA